MKASTSKIKTKAKKIVSKDIGFRKGDFVVYPTHGVGRVLGVETQEISGHSLQVIIIFLTRTARRCACPSPRPRTPACDACRPQDHGYGTGHPEGLLPHQAGHGSRRAQEYEAKINLGDPVSIAEVVRDPHRTPISPTSPIAQRQIYQAALDRLVRELAAVESIDETAATQKLEQLLKAA
jgi:CarD family transcriptional regulator